MASSKNINTGLIDTHSHLQVERLDSIRTTLVEEAKTQGVIDMILCAGTLEDFPQTRSVAHHFGVHYALGIHPLFVKSGSLIETIYPVLEAAIQNALADPLFVAIGEIGLDGMCEKPSMEQQIACFKMQLKLARLFSLPVSIHARHAVDLVTKEIRNSGITNGVVHAFNGSDQQAKILIDLGFKLGLGGAMLFEGSKRIRHLAATIPDNAYVLETDCPDMPSSVALKGNRRESHPSDIALYAKELAKLRNTDEKAIINQSFANASSVFTRLK